MIDFEKNKNNFRKYIIILFFILALSVVFFVMYKYNVEGEQNMPFNITKLIMISSAETSDLEFNDGLYQANVIQNNDIYIGIEKNENYKKQDAIKKITFNNFRETEAGKVGDIKIYRTSTQEKTFNYVVDFEIENAIEILGDLNTDLKAEKMTVSNQGGLLAFSIVTNNLGKITYENNENITSDGTLLKRLNIETEDIKRTICFDILIELTSGKAFKGKIELELPAGNVSEDGVRTFENTNLEKIVFKRV